MEASTKIEQGREKVTGGSRDGGESGENREQGKSVEGNGCIGEGEKGQRKWRRDRI